MFWRLIGTLFVGSWVLSGFQMLGCEAVSFSGSRRLMEWSCFDLPFGVTDLPTGYYSGPMMGTVILVASFAVLTWFWWRFVVALRDAMRTPTPPTGQQLLAEELAKQIWASQSAAESAKEPDARALSERPPECKVDPPNTTGRHESTPLD